jgi:hypothetical protein
MKIKLLLFGLLIITTLACNNKKIEKIPGVFPEIINKHKKTSEIIEKNSKKLNINQKYNENDAIIELITAKYEKNLELSRYKYKNSNYAYSEFSISKDSNYEPFSKSEYAYQIGDQVVILSNEYIYTINLAICDLNLLKITPSTTIKMPKNKMDLLTLSDKLFINDDNIFPFFKSYIKRENKYKDIIIYTIEALKNDEKDTKKLEEFIKKQKIIEETEKYILFSPKEESSLFLWNKEKSILFLNFTEEDLEKIKEL